MGKAESQAKWYENNKDVHKKNVAVRRAKIKAETKALIDTLKSSTPCKDCGIKYPPYVMNFDHLRDKKFIISKAMRAGYKLEIVLIEIAKCDIVCANCHRIRTQERINGR